MSVRIALAATTALIVAAFWSADAPAQRAPVETRIPVNAGVSLYARTIGQGQPLIVLHGGPDFDSAYLLPDLDRLRDGFHLYYYDQRGRGRSAEGVRPDDVTLASDIEDIDRVRRHFHLGSMALLGHSWGAVLALEYALQYPTRLSHLIIMNPAPASTADSATFRRAYLAQLGADMDKQRAIASGSAYQAAEPEAVAARYRIHFKYALQKPDDYERLMAAMRAQFMRQGKDGIVKARAVEDRLMLDTWQKPDYDLLPKLRSLHVPTIVITGDHDFIPAEIAEHIAHSIPNAQFVTLKDCGHFAYLECGAQVREALDAFFRTAPARP